MHCSADNDGGAVWIDGTNCRVLNCDFNSCYADDGNGGAIYVKGDNSYLESCSFINCHAESLC